jgi:spore coat polysaccharide biosynthesis protein SpsF
MNRAVFITVRTGSTRLPNKTLLEINGKKTIEYVIEIAKRCKKANFVVLCTTTNPNDDILEEIAKKHNIECFRGSEEDKLERWKGATEKFDVDYFVTADGDDLLCDPGLMDLEFEQYDKNGADFIDCGEDILCGAVTYGIKTNALNKVCEIKDSENTEMMWTYFKDTGLFNVEILECEKFFRRTDIRLTLDYPEDLEIFQKIFDHFGETTFELRDVINYLDANQEIIKINQFRLKDWADVQKQKTKLVLKDKNIVKGEEN